MSDTLTNGRKFRVLNVIDDHNREALLNEAFYSIPAERLVNSLKQLMQYRPKLLQQFEWLMRYRGISLLIRSI